MCLPAALDKLSTTVVYGPNTFWLLLQFCPVCMNLSLIHCLWNHQHPQLTLFKDTFSSDELPQTMSNPIKDIHDGVLGGLLLFSSVVQVTPKYNSIKMLHHAAVAAEAVTQILPQTPDSFTPAQRLILEIFTKLRGHDVFIKDVLTKKNKIQSSINAVNIAFFNAEPEKSSFVHARNLFVAQYFTLLALDRLLWAEKNWALVEGTGWLANLRETSKPPMYGYQKDLLYPNFGPAEKACRQKLQKWPNHLKETIASLRNIQAWNGPNLSATPNQKLVELLWHTHSNAESYQIFRVFVLAAMGLRSLLCVDAHDIVTGKKKFIEFM